MTWIGASANCQSGAISSRQRSLRQLRATWTALDGDGRFNAIQEMPVVIEILTGWTAWTALSLLSEKTPSYWLNKCPLSESGADMTRTSCHVAFRPDTDIRQLSRCYAAL